MQRHLHHRISCATDNQPDAHLTLQCNVFALKRVFFFFFFLIGQIFQIQFFLTALLQSYQTLAIYPCVYKQLAKNTNVRAWCQNFSRPPEHQRVKDDGTCRDSCFLCPLFTNFEHFFVDVTHHCVRRWRPCFVRHVMIGDVLPRWRLMGLYFHPLLTIIHRASVLQEAERDVTYIQSNTKLNLRKGFQTFRSTGSQMLKPLIT